MGIVISPQSNYAKELARWNRTTREFDEDGLPGHRPAEYQHYPLMLYKAMKLPSGKVVCMEPEPNAFLFNSPADHQRAVLAAEHFTRQCQRTVKSADEERTAKREGWCDTPAKALEHFEGLEQDIANAAAEAQYAAQRMSGKAKGELNAAQDAAGIDHVSDVKPEKRR